KNQGFVSCQISHSHAVCSSCSTCSRCWRAGLNLQADEADASRPTITSGCRAASTKPAFLCAAGQGLRGWALWRLIVGLEVVDEEVDLAAPVRLDNKLQQQVAAGRKLGRDLKLVPRALI